VREALLARDPAAWLVVVTDRPEEDLGVGLLAHFVGHKLRTPDPWEAVRQQFSATGIEASLYTDSESRDIAHGLLMARPEQGWPPAPAGTLTRDHALMSVAREWLDVPRRSLDSLTVLQWTASAELATRTADLRALAGDQLTDATLAWICANAGTAQEPLQHLLRRGEIHDAMPLGLVLGLINASDDGSSRDAPSDHTRELALARLAHRWGGSPPSTTSLAALGEAATQVMRDLLRSDAPRDLVKRLLAKADALVKDADVTELAVESDVLPRGLTTRLHDVAYHLLNFVQARPGETLTSAEATAHITAIEQAWARVESHLLSHRDSRGREDPRLAPMHAAVRLSRWLTLDPGDAGDLAATAMRHIATDAWVDAAVNDAYTGVSEPELAEALTAVLAAVRVRRDEHDRAFANVLAAATESDEGTAEGFVQSADGEKVWLLEDVLARVVIPLAKHTPTLFMILDGMSAAVATEIVADVLDRHEGWQETLLPGAARRSAALAVLPSLTDVSRASLLSGTRTTGGQEREQSGYRALVEAYGLGHSQLFHKKPLDTSRPGYAVADDVAHAIADTDQPLVTCVLNTIDDALDRSDPAGTTWTADAVKHLQPLLASALSAGRTVVLTADHGHVVERREGQMRSVPEMTSGRSRAATPPPTEDEVLIRGARVLRPEGAAVLPLTERLRYGPLKAGYHGGATPAEVVVPVIALIPGPEAPDGTGLTLAPPQEPLWWSVTPGSAPSVKIAAQPESPRRTTSRPPEQDAMLFDLPVDQPAVQATTPHMASLGTAVVSSSTYAQQRAVAGRIALTDEQVSAAVEALAAAPGSRLAAPSLAGVLGLPSAAVRGAIAQLQHLLNVESYPVLRSEGPTAILDLQLLREQFGIGGSR